MPDETSDVDRMLEAHNGSSDPENRSSPFGASGDSPEQWLAEDAQERQREATPEPTPDAASEEPEVHPENIVHILDGRIDADGNEIGDDPARRCRGSASGARVLR